MGHGHFGRNHFLFRVFSEMIMVLSSDVWNKWSDLISTLGRLGELISFFKGFIYQLFRMKNNIDPTPLLIPSPLVLGTA